MARRRDTEDAYVARVNRVLDHISAHIGEPLPLAALAKIAHFSPFHFHRVFRSVTGETLRDHVARVRVERAAALLQRGDRARTALEIAALCGFEGPSQLSRAFRAHFGVTPSAYRRGARATPEVRKNRQDDGRRRPYPLGDFDLAKNADGFRVRIRRLEATRIAYLRVADPYTPGNVPAGIGRLLGWARARGIGGKGLMGMSQDDPDVTPLAQCRYDVCLPVGAELRAEGEIGVRAMPACMAATLEVTGDMAKAARAWDWLFDAWLPGSGWEPADMPAMETYRSAPDPAGRLDLEYALPVVRVGRRA